MPEAEKLAVVETAFGLPKATVPAPLIWLHVVVVTPGGLGFPSSVTLPLKLTITGQITVWFVPADTMGAMFVGGIVNSAWISASERRRL